MSDVKQRLGHASFVPHPWPVVPLDRRGQAKVGKRRLVKPKRVAKRGRRTVKTL